MLKSLLLGMSRTPAVKKAVIAFPLTRRVVQRFVAGETVDACLQTTRGLLANGLLATIDFLGEDTTTAVQADRVTDTYVELLQRLSAEGLADRVEVSIKLSALGSLLKGGYELALDNARVICTTAERAGTTVTVDMEDHTSTDATLRTVTTLREHYPWVGAVLQTMLFGQVRTASGRPGRATASGCARAPTPNRPMWRTRRSQPSIATTSAARRSCSRARGVRCSRRTTTR